MLDRLAALLRHDVGLDVARQRAVSSTPQPSTSDRLEERVAARASAAKGLAATPTVAALFELARDSWPELVAITAP